MYLFGQMAPLPAQRECPGSRGAGQTDQLRPGNDRRVEATLQYTSQRLDIKGGEAIVENVHMRFLQQRSREIETAAFAMRQSASRFRLPSASARRHSRQHSPSLGESTAVTW